MAEASGKLSTVVSGLVTKVAELVTAGNLVACTNTIYDIGHPVRPVCGIWLGTFQRVNKQWTGTAVIQVLAQSADQVTPALELLIARIAAKIEAQADAAGRGGEIESPRFDTWGLPGAGGTYQVVGAIGQCTITVEDPLLTS